VGFARIPRVGGILANPTTLKSSGRNSGESHYPKIKMSQTTRFSVAKDSRSGNNPATLYRFLFNR